MPRLYTPRETKNIIVTCVSILAVLGMAGTPDFARGQVEDDSAGWISLCKSVHEFGVLPSGDAETNRANLQKAIEWAAPRGAAMPGIRAFKYSISVTFDRSRFSGRARHGIL